MYWKMAVSVCLRVSQLRRQISSALMVLNMAIDPGLRDRRRIGAHVTGIAVWQIEREEMRLLRDATDDDHGFAKIGLRMARCMRQRHEHLAPQPFMLTQVILHDGIAANEPVLIPQPFENTLGGVALLAVPALILSQPRIDNLGEPIQLRPLDLGPPPVTGRHRKTQHLLHAVARNPEMTRRRTLTHAVSTSKTHLPIQFHGENTPALPAARKGQSGRLLRRPQQDHPAATVADYCSAAYTYVGGGIAGTLGGAVRALLPRSGGARLGTESRA